MACGEAKGMVIVVPFTKGDNRHPPADQKQMSLVQSSQCHVTFRLLWKRQATQPCYDEPDRCVGNSEI